MSDSDSIQEIPVQDSSSVDRLVSDAFGYKKPHHFFQDFPVWGSAQARRFGIFKDSKLVSHVGIRVTQLNGSPVGLVGAVATDALYRGQGLSSKLLTHVIEFGKSKKLDWLILWGSEHEFYSKFGFELAGIQTRIALDALIKANPPSSRSIPVQSGYQPKIFDWMTRDQSGPQIELQPADRAWFEKHETVKWYRTDQPFAFVGFERGMDLPHLAHEWGGDANGLSAIFDQIRKKDPNAELLTHPLYLQKLGVGPDIEHANERLCLAKPLKGQSEWPEAFWISGLNAC